MARLNKKSTKENILKLLKENEANKGNQVHYFAVMGALHAVAKELEIDIKPEEYKASQ